MPETLFHFLHQLAAIIWVGGVLALNALQLLHGRGNDRAAQGSLLQLTDLYGRAVIAPAAILTLITGGVLVAQMDLAWTELWVVWGVAGVLFSFGLGATLIRVTNADLRRLAGEPFEEGEWQARQRRAATLYAVNLLMLLSTVWATIFKPTL
jgi:uncharacterized membrane protein